MLAFEVGVHGLPYLNHKGVPQAHRGGVEGSRGGAGWGPTGRERGSRHLTHVREDECRLLLVRAGARPPLHHITLVRAGRAVLVRVVDDGLFRRVRDGVAACLARRRQQRGRQVLQSRAALRLAKSRRVCTLGVAVAVT
eukprot:7384167-Prymnesium_polylepis.1